MWSRLTLAAALADSGEPAAAERLIAADLDALPAPLRPAADELLVRCLLADGRIEEAAAAVSDSARTGGYGFRP